MNGRVKRKNAHRPSSSPISGEVAAPRPEGDVRACARRMRRAMRHHEVLLWLQIKSFNGEYGSHFRRQAPAGGYILDYVDFGRRLVIEADGWQHGEPAGRAHDEKRDAYLARSGFCTLRFWSHEIDQNLDGVYDAILATAQQQASRYSSQRIRSPSGRYRGHLPRKGEGC
jgi:very-short-patch-repair endonuclease